MGCLNGNFFGQNALWWSVGFVLKLENEHMVLIICWVKLNFTFSSKLKYEIKIAG